ncbi:DEAD/DEAH box helicase [Actinomadura roseirufa]|uniref:DEAD/DEAH box helicase n=1 Tax=Actinomadura roseirufa TaxID=2094049 RepID=UPI0010417A01|nr:DEAD/DEAH box helicase [Actinomadura roseirufa]
MDVFGVRERLISDYQEFTGSFVTIHDPRIRGHVEARTARGYQWPDPWLSLNPNFASGGSVTDLVASRVLAPGSEKIFRLKDQDVTNGPALRLHEHQREAAALASRGSSYVLTTGTGSGKSLTYIIPIVDWVLRAKADGSYAPGVKAIVVYPMNALANSQLGELEKFLGLGFPDGPPVTFARYTGQEPETRRQEIIADPPDILLTNYVMLELVLTRPKESKLIQAAQGLRFLVLDELHTYRGRQGADVALLTRRLRLACKAPDVQCIGTSATMTSEGDTQSQREKVAGVASTLFGVRLAPEHVVGETLERVTAKHDLTSEDLRERVTAGAELSAFSQFVGDPLASWVEEQFGFEPGLDIPVRRRRPPTLAEAAADLSAETGAEPTECERAIRDVLQAGSQIKNRATGRPVFAFRMHQFLSKGDNVYVTIEAPNERHITSTYQVAAPGEEGEKQRVLIPVAFCRECGQDYLAVTRLDDAGHRYVARNDRDASAGDDASGYLYISEDQPWPDNLEQILVDGRLPYSWLKYDPVYGQVVDPNKMKFLPKPTRVETTGREADTGVYAAYVPSPFRFCLRCRASYEQVRGSDFAKLAKLSAEGRSSAMSLISASVVRALNGLEDEHARKLLAFVDNRQDASLQAGHFNDFVQVTQLRGALYRALRDAPEGLTDEVIAQRVTDALGLSMSDFAQKPNAKYSVRDDTWRALREVVGYRLYLDLERGWRVTMPNLEQTGLLRIEYRDLEEIAADHEAWDGSHSALCEDDRHHRYEIAAALLDELRRNLAIEVGYLNGDEGFDPVRRLSQNHLKEPWSLPERERPPLAGVAFPGPGKPGKERRHLFLSGRGAFGRFLIREYGIRRVQLTTADAEEIIRDLLHVLSEAGVLSVAVQQTEDGVQGYQLRAAAIRWRAGDGKAGAEDRVRRSLDNEEGPRVNPFFRDLYRDMAATLARLRAKEHTAQVSSKEREEREEEFRDADLPVLYCSPTMELGVDIKALNAVALRNVPPTPANYAQRAGRAGRSGQPALVVTYCATGNAHDQYYFRRPTDMVGGAVAAPRLDLTNEDLVRSHLHAIWLAETGQDLRSSLTQILDVAGEHPTLKVIPKVAEQLADEGARQRAITRGRDLLGGIDMTNATWWRERWVEDVIARAPVEFDQACNRWRDLYRVALDEFHVQSRNSVDTSRRASDRDKASRRARDARTQLRLLSNDDTDDFSTDFYSYRYFASEGFLPGYSFPRLPLSAYIPGLTGRRDGDYIQRPRFVGISEFGPGAVIYHEGARYQVVSAQLPPIEPGQDSVTTGSARRCGACGYLHNEEVGTDTCDACTRPLRDTTRSLLRLTSVRTQRRDRISSDEEERRRSGFELQTSYRFHSHGDRPDRLEAVAAHDDDPVLNLAYGDSATVRVTNLGRRRRQKPDVHGYWIDITTGRWLSESAAAGKASPEESELEDAEDVKRKERVIPYVEDRRNILVVRLGHQVSREAAVSFAVALERGVEAAFQLEDSELSSELLPDSDDRGRLLLVESSEGGAGVLRRLVEEGDALRRAARTALEIMHFHPETGADESRDREDRERCVMACYECLLSYGNQTVHSMINRHLVRDLMLDVAHSTVIRNGHDRPTEAPQPASPLAARFVAWLIEHDLRLPDQVDQPVGGCTPDLVYRLRDNDAVVFVGGEPDHDTTDDLMDLGITVIRVGDSKTWETAVTRYQSVFGTSTRGRQ